MSSSTEAHSLFSLTDVSQEKCYKAKNLQNSNKGRKVKDKQIRDVEIDRDNYAGKDRHVGSEILRVGRWQARRSLKMVILITNLIK